MIVFQEEIKQFDLMSQHCQMTLGILPSGHLATYYFGERIGSVDLRYVVKDIQRASYMADTDCIKDFKLEQMPLAYPAYGNPDMRTPAFQLVMADGSRITNLRYAVHHIGKKQSLQGLPSCQHETAETLTIELVDHENLIKISLLISVFPDHDVFTQSVKIENIGKAVFSIDRCMSGNLDFLTDSFDVLTLGGAWGREMHQNRRSVCQGFQGVDSKRGASGHGQNPFIALLSPNTDEEHGTIYSMNLVYSGDFLALADVDMHQNTRLQIGINPFDFAWQLAPQDIFTAPEVVMVCAQNGLNQLSMRYHRFYTECLIPPTYATRPRPILMNNWEATYFAFNRDTLLAMAEEGYRLGIELFVLDDGWFGQRNSDDSSLGDWMPNESKLGGTLTELIEHINQIGLEFGLWIEPEMVSPNSQLFQKHPDWIIKVNRQVPQQVRHQYVLDLSRKEIQDYLIETLTDLLAGHNISYLKWDMNRNITDSGSSALSSNAQRELGHRYILGLYRVLDIITQRFPDVLLESCAGGGGRFDPGMLAYSPQIWTSDDTDAIERLAIQKGTALIYPQASMSCHVSAVPNHQVGRVTSLNTRGIVAQQGNFGYELNLLDLSDAEKKDIHEQILAYKEQRDVLQFGAFRQLSVYDPTNEYAWLQMKDNQVIVSYVHIRVRGNTVPKRLKLSGLDPKQQYVLSGKETCITGKELMTIGISLPKPKQDYFAARWYFVTC